MSKRAIVGIVPVYIDRARGYEISVEVDGALVWESFEVFETRDGWTLREGTPPQGCEAEEMEGFEDAPEAIAYALTHGFSQPEAEDPEADEANDRARAEEES
jgi:hypothetical protein